MEVKKSLKLKKLTPPTILLVGAGRFGRHHLRIWREMHDQGKIIFKGVVLRNEDYAKKIEKEFGVKTFKKISRSLLSSVSAVDIVTPPETHYSLVKRCLPHTNVFVEKPLAMRVKEARVLKELAEEHQRVLMVGHIFRFHSVQEKLQTLLSNKNMPKYIEGDFINPTASDQDRDVSFELLHLFDAMDSLWPNMQPESIYVEQEERISRVSFKYLNGTHAHFIIGWKGNEKKRRLSFRYAKKVITANYEEGEIVISTKKNKKIFTFDMTEGPLRKELSSFIESLRDSSKNISDGSVGVRVVQVSERVNMLKKKEKYRVAVIGGGIFGSTIALELSQFCDVTIFERNKNLLSEGSFINQFRHHHGYHYPRSDETVTEVQASKASFEKIFKKAIITNYPTYYGLAKEDSLVSSKEFKIFCKRHNLPYVQKFPHFSLLKKEKMSLCVQVLEPSYQHSILKRIIKKRLVSNKNITLRLDTVVDSYEIMPQGNKRIIFSENKKKIKDDDFDFVINATYANINQFSNKLGFEHFPVRVDLVEVLIVHIPIAPVSLTVIDGPFATLMPTGNPNEFTLYHVKESILDRYVPKNGILKKKISSISNTKAIMEESKKLFPILEKATIVESRIVHRGVQAYREHDDARVADIISHGFGCWSVLSGKILSSVSIGKKIADTIKRFY